MQENIVSEIVGHSSGKITFSRYGKDFQPKVKLDAMKKLDYDFDMFEILGKTPLDEATIAGQVEKLLKR